MVTQAQTGSKHKEISKRGNPGILKSKNPFFFSLLNQSANARSGSDSSRKTKTLKKKVYIYVGEEEKE